MIKKLYFMALMIASGLAVTAQQFYVSLYEDCNFSGRKITLEAGNYKADEMRIGNDRLSSMEIPAGMKVTIYENDKYEGRSRTFTSNQRCLEPEWRNMASSIVVENTNIPNGYTQGDYVTFYNDCYSKGYSKSLRPGAYSGSQLGELRYNISSLAISGNLQVKAYLNSENLSGYSVIIDASQFCLPNNQNDKIGSLVIETRPRNNYGNDGHNDGDHHDGNNNGGYNNGNNLYATLYQGCNYTGKAIRLEPGIYPGDKLGIMKYHIASMELSPGLRIKLYTNNEYLTGQSYTYISSESCLNNNLRNSVGSVQIELINGNNGYNNHDNNNDYNHGNNNYDNNHGNNNHVILYEDGNYRGRSATLLPGTYGNMQVAGFSDKSLSSLFVPAGWRVIIYEGQNFTGKSFTITTSLSGFTFTKWNDRASSIKIYRN